MIFVTFTSSASLRTGVVKTSRYATQVKQMFPETVHYSRTDQPTGWNIPDWDAANTLLGYLDPDRRHFAVFTLDDYCYVQCLGRKTALTVEARVYSDASTFRHFVFGKGVPTGEAATVGNAKNFVSVDASQVLKMRDARLIIRKFLETRTFHDGYTATDVTSRFDA